MFYMVNRETLGWLKTIQPMASFWLGVLDSSDPAIKKRLLLKGTLMKNPQTTGTQTNN